MEECIPACLAECAPECMKDVENNKNCATECNEFCHSDCKAEIEGGGDEDDEGDEGDEEDEGDEDEDEDEDDGDDYEDETDSVDSRSLGPKGCEPHCVHECRIECVSDGTRTGKQCDDTCEKDCKTYCGPVIEGKGMTDGDKLLESRRIHVVKSSNPAVTWLTYGLVLCVLGAVGFLAFKKYLPDGLSGRGFNSGYFKLPSMGAV